MVANVLIYGIADVGLDTFDCFHYDKNKKSGYLLVIMDLETRH